VTGIRAVMFCEDLIRLSTHEGVDLIFLKVIYLAEWSAWQQLSARSMLLLFVFSLQVFHELPKVTTVGHSDTYRAMLYLNDQKLFIQQKAVAAFSFVRTCIVDPGAR
jgi:hypothetical protein